MYTTFFKMLCGNRVLMYFWNFLIRKRMISCHPSQLFFLCATGRLLSGWLSLINYLLVKFQLRPYKVSYFEFFHCSASILSIQNKGRVARNWGAGECFNLSFSFSIIITLLHVSPTRRRLLQVGVISHSSFYSHLQVQSLIQFTTQTYIRVMFLKKNYFPFCMSKTFSQVSPGYYLQGSWDGNAKKQSMFIFYFQLPK